MFEFQSTMPDDIDECYEEERFLSRKALSGEVDEPQLRPRRWAEYFGQEKVKANLDIAIQATRARGDALDHILLYGPPGLGKTTLAGIIAHELGVEMRITSGPAIERQGDLAAILTNLNEHDVLFIDEIHRLNRTVEEILYPAMEDYALDILIGKGPSARSIRLDLPKFTLIGATTRAGLLTSPLRDRFGMIQRLDLYEPSELSQILERYASLIGVGIDADGLKELSTRCRGTPRVAIRLLRRMRDYAQVKGNNVINKDICDMGLSALDIDPVGLDGNDRLIMRVMAEMYDGGPVGLDTLAASTGEDAVTIEDIYEPYLMQIGFVAKTPRGRILTRGGFSHLGLPFIPKNERNVTTLGQVTLQDILDTTDLEQNGEHYQ